MFFYLIFSNPLKLFSILFPDDPYPAFLYWDNWYYIHGTKDNSHYFFSHEKHYESIVKTLRIFNIFQFH